MSYIDTLRKNIKKAVILGYDIQFNSNNTECIVSKELKTHTFSVKFSCIYDDVEMFLLEEQLNIDEKEITYDILKQELKISALNKLSDIKDVFKILTDDEIIALGI